MCKISLIVKLTVLIQSSVFVNGRSRSVIMENMSSRIDRGDIKLERAEAIKVGFRTLNIEFCELIYWYQGHVRYCCRSCSQTPAINAPYPKYDRHRYPPNFFQNQCHASFTPCEIGSQGLRTPRQPIYSIWDHPTKVRKMSLIV